MTNIVEAMLQFNKHMIIMISGLSGSGRTKLARFIADIFKFKLIDMKNFNHAEEYYDKPENYIELNDGSKILNWDDIEKSINWVDLNDTVNANKATGVVVVGLGFPSKLIGFKSDQHIHIKISKDRLVENRHKYLDTHPNDRNYKYKGTPLEKQIINRITIPMYIKMRDNSIIDRYINMSDIDIEMAKTMIFKHLIAYITKWLETYNVPGNLANQSNKPSKPTGNLNVNYEGNSKAYDDYFHNMKRKQYDFNQEGDDFPAMEKKDEDLDKKSTSSIDDTSNSDAEFLWTIYD